MHLEISSRRTLTGIALMALASLALPVVDGIAKSLSSGHSPFFVAWARYATAAGIVLPMTLMFYRSDYPLVRNFASNALRTALIVAAMTCFFFAITKIPLATAFGGYFLGPVIAAVLAVPLLRERLTWSRVAVALTGFCGAYLIVRPTADLSFGSLLAIASGALFAGYLIATRVTVATTPPIDALRFQCVFGALLLTPAALIFWSWPTRDELLLIASMGAISAACHFLIIAAFRYAEVAVLSPLSYLELVSAIVIGGTFFAEVPDAMAFGGISLIALSGLIIWATERG